MKTSKHNTSPLSNCVPLHENFFCFGLGYTAARLALKLKSNHWDISGTLRKVNRNEISELTGIKCIPFDRDQQLIPNAKIFSDANFLLSSIPPDNLGDPVIQQYKNAIANSKSISWVGYLSTTGVYGNRDGNWVDENDKPLPGNERSRRRVLAENQWLDLWKVYGIPVHIFRLAGIYGPTRNALESLRTGKAKRIHKPGHAFSRIHVDDIVQILIASMVAPNSGSIYNVCDDEAAPPSEVITYACQLLGIKPPPLENFDPNNLSSMALTFWSENRRVRNNRIKDELKVALHYPNYRVGLTALRKLYFT